MLYQSVGVLSFNKLDANNTAGFSTQQFSLIAAIFPLWLVQPLWDGTWINWIQPQIFIPDCFCPIHCCRSGEIFLLGLTIFLIGALLAGAHYCHLQLCSIQQCAAQLVDAWYWSYWCNFRCFLWLFTFNLSLSGIFFILALPTHLLHLAWKWFMRNLKTNKARRKSINIKR